MWQGTIITLSKVYDRISNPIHGRNLGLHHIQTRLGRIPFGLHVFSPGSFHTFAVQHSSVHNWSPIICVAFYFVLMLFYHLNKEMPKSLMKMAKHYCSYRYPRRHFHQGNTVRCATPPPEFVNAKMQFTAFPPKKDRTVRLETYCYTKTIFLAYCEQQ